ncbi:MAG: RES family NAD+ phosphorylase [Pseudomonadota bacterium]
MSSTTWTPAAVASEGRHWQGQLWRAVEAQHRVSTLRLVDTLAEQSQLEALLETSKPTLPESKPRHYLLLTPFRYPAVHPGGSRFRSATDPGVFYGADEVRTACAELGYWRWRFLMDSPALERLAALPHTLFQAGVAGLAIHLTEAPFTQDAARWNSRQDYSACQHVAGVARAAHLDLIRYRSVRDPDSGMCAAVLQPAALVTEPLVEQTWRLAVTRERVQWRRDSALHVESFEFAATMLSA